MLPTLSSRTIWGPIFFYGVSALLFLYLIYMIARRRPDDGPGKDADGGPEL